jgi:hypothetical protein
MSRSLVIEEQRGTCRGHVHPHDGYYAGDFSTPAAPIAQVRQAPPWRREPVTSAASRFARSTVA